MTHGRPLTGITVVALEQAVSAPMASRTLAGLGARMIKVEPLAGDFARHYATSSGGWPRTSSGSTGGRSR